MPEYCPDPNCPARQAGAVPALIDAKGICPVCGSYPNPYRLPLFRECPGVLSEVLGFLPPGDAAVAGMATSGFRDGFRQLKEIKPGFENKPIILSVDCYVLGCAFLSENTLVVRGKKPDWWNGDKIALLNINNETSEDVLCKAPGVAINTMVVGDQAYSLSSYFAYAKGDTIYVHRTNVTHLLSPNEPINCLVPLPNAYLISVSRERGGKGQENIIMWDIKTGIKAGTFENPLGDILFLAACKLDEKYHLVSVEAICDDNNELCCYAVNRYDLNTGKRVTSCEMINCCFGKECFTVLQDRFLAVIGSTRPPRIDIFDIRGDHARISFGSRKYYYLPYSYSYTCLGALPDGLLAVGCDDGIIEIWDANKRECIKHLGIRHRTGRIEYLAISPQGCLASVSGDNARELTIWNKDVCRLIIPGDKRYLIGDPC